jgi:hypothetical protein
MFTFVFDPNVTVPLPRPGPTEIVVVELAAPFSPMLIVFVLPDAVTPLAMYTGWVPVLCPITITPVAVFEVPPSSILPVV